MSETSATIWWIELIKISPGLITVLFCIVLVILNRKTLTAMFERMTKFRGLGVEAEFATKDLDSAIASHEVAVSADDRKGALKRLNLTAPLLRDARVLWVDDEPASTRSERALLEKAGKKCSRGVSVSETGHAEGTSGRIRLNVALPIPFDGFGTLEVDLLCGDARVAIELDGGQHLADPAAAWTGFIA